MRTVVFFDLPTLTFNDQRNYRRFHKFLVNEGFIMMQESVYSKICLNLGQSKYLYDRIRKVCPKDGIVEVLNVTEKQYASIEYIAGKSQNKIIDNLDRLVIL